jgi:hypothetical protein
MLAGVTDAHHARWQQSTPAAAAARTGGAGADLTATHTRLLATELAPQSRHLACWRLCILRGTQPGSLLLSDA